MERRGYSISDVRLINFLRKELSLSKEMLRGLRYALSMLNEANLEEAKRGLYEIMRSKEEASSVQRDLLNYISKVSSGLYHREDWIRVSSKVSNIADKFSGIAYRLEFFINKKWITPNPVKERLIKISDLLHEMIEKFDQILYAAINDPEKGLVLIDEIDKYESQIDEEYRQATFAILDSNLSVPGMVLLLNVAEMLEDVSDTLNLASDDIYIVVLDLI